MNISSLNSKLYAANNIFTTSRDSQNDLKSASASKNFGQILNQQLEEVNSLQKDADRLTEDFLVGEPVEIHQMLIAMEKADLALRQTVEIRNKMLEAYKQITNMQI